MSTLNLLQNKMNLTTSNLSLISDNIANINTPEYKRKYIDVQGEAFASNLSTKIKKTNSKHLSRKDGADGSTIEVDAYVRTDGNGVDVDAEILELNKNKLFHNSLITLFNNEVNNMRNIITSK